MEDTRSPGLTWLTLLGTLVVGASLVSYASQAASNESRLELEHSVEVPPEVLFELITTRDGIELWWQHANERMGEQFEVRHLGGPEAGVGLRIGFAAPGGDVFEHWTFTEVQSPSLVRMDVDFLIGTVFDRSLELSPQGSGTLVHWLETGLVESQETRDLLEQFEESAIENRRTVLDAAAVAVAGRSAPGSP